MMEVTYLMLICLLFFYLINFLGGKTCLEIKEETFKIKDKFMGLNYFQKKEYFEYIMEVSTHKIFNLY